MPRMTRALTTLLLTALLAPAAARAEDAPPAEAKPEAKAAPRKARETYAVFVTSRGKIAARLLPGETPNAVKNFVELATGKKEWTDPATQKPTREKLYDGTLFHRVIPGFMIQGGDPTSRGQPTEPKAGYGVHGPGYRFADELRAGARPFDEPCQLAMANSGPNTNGSQFFITEAPAKHLNPKPCPGEPSRACGGYVRFGVGVCPEQCVQVVKAIAAAGPARTRLEKVLIVHEKPSCQ
jgi:peptidylprolyl isomerase/peptidyl-prolyl cis-trans isomerase A (cyclophilin A)